MYLKWCIINWVSLADSNILAEIFSKITAHTSKNKKGIKIKEKVKICSRGYRVKLTI